MSGINFKKTLGIAEDANMVNVNLDKKEKAPPKKPKMDKKDKIQQLVQMNKKILQSPNKLNKLTSEYFSIGSEHQLPSESRNS